MGMMVIFGIIFAIFALYILRMKRYVEDEKRKSKLERMKPKSQIPGLIGCISSLALEVLSVVMFFAIIASEGGSPSGCEAGFVIFILAVITVPFYANFFDKDWKGFSFWVGIIINLLFILFFLANIDGVEDIYFGAMFISSLLSLILAKFYPKYEILGIIRAHNAEVERVAREKKEAEEKASNAAAESKKALENVIADVKRFELTEFITEFAKNSVNDIKAAVRSAEKAIKEAESSAEIAKNSKSLQDKKNAAAQAETSAEATVAYVDSIKKTISSANYEESAYKKAINDINDAFSDSKKSAKNSLIDAERAVNAAYASAKATEAAAKAVAASKNAAMLSEKIAECVSEVKAKVSVRDAQDARSIASRAVELAQKAKAEESNALQQKVIAIGEEKEKLEKEAKAKEEKRLIDKATKGTPQDKYELSVWYRSEKNLEKSIHWLKQSAELGNATAQRELGSMYLKGEI